jgi:hypothetical protein
MRTLGMFVLCYSLSLGIKTEPKFGLNEEKSTTNDALV